jgi:hypothetical protein
VIEELIQIAREMRVAQDRGEALGLTSEEVAFYDALETNDSAVAVLGDETLRIIAREVAETVRRNATIDWTVQDSARANLRRLVRRVLNKYGYPPDQQDRVTQTVIEQAQLFVFELVETGEPPSAPEPVAASAPFKVVSLADHRASWIAFPCTPCRPRPVASATRRPPSRRRGSCRTAGRGPTRACSSHRWWGSR